MKKLSIALTVLLMTAPALASAQQQPPVPPRAGVVRPGVAPRMQRRFGQFQPRFQRQMLRQQMLRQQMLRAQMGGRFAPQWQDRFGPQWQGGRFAPRPGMVPALPGAGPNLLALRQQLNLTDDQVKRLEAIREEARASQQKWQEQTRAEREKLLDQQRALHEKFAQEQRTRQEAVAEKMKQVLTAEQQKQLEELRQRRGRGMMPRRDLEQ